jgi:hypothetical protein
LRPRSGPSQDNGGCRHHDFRFDFRLFETGVFFLVVALGLRPVTYSTLVRKYGFGCSVFANRGSDL